jgi:hypothetical protein
VNRLFAAVVSAAFLAAGCSSSGEPSSLPTASSSPTATVTPASSEPAGRPAGKRRPVVLEAKALVLAVDDMTTNDLPFGEAGVATTQREMGRLGFAGELQSLTGCGDGSSRVITYPGLSVYFSDDKLSGWSVRTDDVSGLTTATGISLTTTRDQVQDAYDGKVKVFESTLGTEWTAPDGISGLFKDATPNAAVATFWSGRTCIAR